MVPMVNSESGLEKLAVALVSTKPKKQGTKTGSNAFLLFLSGLEFPCSY